MISALEVDQRIEYLTFRDIPYRIKINIKYRDYINIELVDRSTNVVYFGDFVPTYVEEMTRKTGNFKKFSVFAEMLLSAIDNRPSSSPLAVSLDLLSSTDLNALRNSTSHSRCSNDGDKRYLILTYATAYDRVHYPLPLEPKSQETFEMAKMEDFHKLQMDFDELKAQYEESIEKLAKVMIENDKLRHQLKYAPDESKNLRKVNAELREQVEFLTNQIKREMDLIKSDAAVRYKRDQSNNQQYLESKIMKLSAELETEISKRNMQIKLKDDRIAHLERQLRISSHKPKSAPVTRTSAGSLSRPASKNRLPSPSIQQNASSKHKRFDPTEYVRSRQDRQKRSGSVTSIRSASVDSRSSMISKNGRESSRKPTKVVTASRSSSVESRRLERGRSPNVFDRLYYNSPNYKNTSANRVTASSNSRLRRPENLAPDRKPLSDATIEDRLSNLHQMIERAKLI